MRTAKQIDTHVRCVVCRYDLYRLAPSSDCSECGSPCCASLQPDRLLFRDAMVVRALYFYLAVMALTNILIGLESALSRSSYAAVWCGTLSMFALVVGFIACAGLLVAMCARCKKGGVGYVSAVAILALLAEFLVSLALDGGLSGSYSLAALGPGANFRIVASEFPYVVAHAAAAWLVSRAPHRLAAYLIGFACAFDVVCTLYVVTNTAAPSLAVPLPRYWEAISIGRAALGAVGGSLGMWAVSRVIRDQQERRLGVEALQIRGAEGRGQTE